MKLVSIKNIGTSFTVGKIYNAIIIYSTEPIYLIERDNFDHSVFGYSEEFISLKEYRKQKLEKIVDTN